MSQIFISRNNSTKLALGSGSSFVGAADVMTSWEEVDINIAGSPANASGTLYFEFSPDCYNWDVSVPLPIASLSNTVPVTLRTILPYFRVRYTNASTPQTEFRLTSVFHRASSMRLTRFLSQSIDPIEPVSITRIARSVLPEGAASELTLQAISTTLTGSMLVQQGSGSSGNPWWVTTTGSAGLLVSVAPGTNRKLTGFITTASLELAGAPAASYVAINSEIAATVGIYVSGTWSGNINFEGTVNGVDWFATYGVPTLGPLTNATAGNGFWAISCAGINQIRAHATQLTTNSTASVSLAASIPSQNSVIINNPSTLPVYVTTTGSLPVTGSVVATVGIISVVSPVTSSGTSGVLLTTEPTVPNRFDINYDTTSDVSNWYYGYAELGSSNSAAVWTVKRISVIAGVATAVRWSASGQIWNNRASLTYT